MAACCLENIYAWRYNLLSRKPVTDFYDTGTVCIHLKDAFDDRCGLGIGNILLGVSRVVPPTKNRSLAGGIRLPAFVE